LAWPSHSCTLAMSAWWSRALVAAVARSACAPIWKSRKVSEASGALPVNRDAAPGGDRAVRGDERELETAGCRHDQPVE